MTLSTLDARPSASSSHALPFVLVNMAMTADGKIATANRRVSTFSSKADQENLYRLRATADAIMCGARTADLNRISLGSGGEKQRQLRKRRGLSENALRVIVSGSGSLDPRAHVFSRGFSPIIVLTTERAGARRLRALRAVADDVKICGKKEIDFHRALGWLQKEFSVKRLLCEGGGELNDALFRAGLVDELHLTICPLILGGKEAPTIADGKGFTNLKDSVKLRLKSRKRIGEELFLVFEGIG